MQNANDNSFGADRQHLLLPSKVRCLMFFFARVDVSDVGWAYVRIRQASVQPTRMRKNHQWPSAGFDTGLTDARHYRSGQCARSGATLPTQHDKPRMDGWMDTRMPAWQDTADRWQTLN